MKVYPFFLLLFLSLPFVSKAQNFSREYGNISKDEMELTEYAQDTEAEAVVLFDIGKSYFQKSESGFDVIFERTTRIKVFSEAGLKWTKIEIPFYQEGGIYEKVYDIEAYTYNFENGRLTKTKLDVSQCYDEKLNKYWNLKKFAMPKVKEGSVIEYRYKISSQYVFNLRDWEFQSKIPTIYSQYEVSMIPYYEYSYLLQGRSKFDFQKSYEKSRGVINNGFNNVEIKDMVHQYVMKNTPAFRDEEFITSINDYIIKIDFQLSKINFSTGGSRSIRTTWAALIKDLNKHNDFGKYIKKSKKAASKLTDLTDISTKTEKERFNSILNYVKNNFEWNGFIGKYASKSPSKFLKEKHGNCADINLFTIGLLNFVGIEAYPVLSSTRQNGKIKYDYPYSHFFNYVLILAKVDGKSILSDATNPLNSNQRIPIRCINEKGLVIEKDKENWVKLKSNLSSEEQSTFSIEPSAQSTEAQVITYATEYDALVYRGVYGENKQKIKEDLDKKSYNVSAEDIRVKNYLNPQKPYFFNYKAKIKTENINDKLYISPFLNEVIAENPFKQKSRKYTIDLIYAQKKTYHSTIKIPEGYQIDYLPTSDNVKNELFEMNYAVTKDDTNIKISFSYFLKKSAYSAGDYSKLKFYYKKIIKRGNEKIVFKKIK